MSRFYTLSERGGIKVVHATAVDEFDLSNIHFLNGSTVTTFERNDLLWWGAVECPHEGPFAVSSPRLVIGSRQAGAHPHWPSQGAQPFHPATAPTDDPVGQHRRRSKASLDRVVEATMPSVPRGWRKTLLELKVKFELPAGTYSIAHRLRNPDTEAEVMDFSDTLFAAIAVFHRVSLSAGENWNQSFLTFSLDATGRLESVEVKHHYGRDFSGR